MHSPADKACVRKLVTSPSGSLRMHSNSRNCPAYRDTSENPLLPPESIPPFLARANSIADVAPLEGDIIKRHQDARFRRSTMRDEVCVALTFALCSFSRRLPAKFAQSSCREVRWRSAPHHPRPRPARADTAPASREKAHGGATVRRPRHKREHRPLPGSPSMCIDRGALLARAPVRDIISYNISH